MSKHTPLNAGWQRPVEISEALKLYLRDLGECGLAFKQTRTAVRAIEFILGLLSTPGRKTCMASRLWRNEATDETADLKAFSRAEWNVHDWYSVVLKQVIAFLQPGQPLVLGMDDTGMRKWGKHIPQARYVHDALAIKWLKQRFMWGIRFLQIAAILPFDYEAGRPYAVPVGFYPKPAAKKPRGKELTEEELAAYEAAKISSLLTNQALEELLDLRRQVDLLGFSTLSMLVVVDGSFMNGSVAKHPIHGIEMLGRIKGTSRLFRRAEVKARNTFYGDLLPTPEALGQDKSLHWKHVDLMWGGELRGIRYKDFPDVYWKSGTGRRPMRLLIVAGTPYKPKNRRSRRGLKMPKFYFRKPGYLLTSDLTTDAPSLIQHYLNRWTLETTFRDLKTGLGVAHPQNTSPESVERIPSAMVAAYSLWMLAVLKTYGPRWQESVAPLRPHQRRRMLRRVAQGKNYTRRYSQQDLIRLLRNELERAGAWGGFPGPSGSLPDRLNFIA